MRAIISLQTSQIIREYYEKFYKSKLNDLNKTNYRKDTNNQRSPEKKTDKQNSTIAIKGIETSANPIKKTLDPDGFNPSRYLKKKIIPILSKFLYKIEEERILSTHSVRLTLP